MKTHCCVSLAKLNIYMAVRDM